MADKKEIKKPEQSENLAKEKQPAQKSILPVFLEDQVQASYLDYAMSVIVARALPDVRDGLKPVHRRILFAMHDMGLKASAKFRKSATVVGEVLGKYHPHGDMAVYDSMVRMAQNFSMRYQLIKGQGNFGSIDGDPPAAMRYTEAKMAHLAEAMLEDIEKETVGFSDNFDATRQEPIVLPAKAPNLLINGSLGIAVGMATNIPPHNLTEVIDGTIAMIKNPEITLDELTEFIKGPDFPTGGNIYNTKAIKEAYATGRGPVVCRGVAKIIEKPKAGFQIIISEIPYQVNKADLVSKIAHLVKSKKIEGISDLRDESDRKDGVRLVIDLKSSAFPKKILNAIYKLTPLQTVFHMNLVALVDGIQPRLLGLKDIISEYIKHRKEVIVKRTQFELKVAKARVHILEGLKIALDFIDEVINTIRSSATRDEAHKNLIQKFKLSKLQADAILEMRLSALAGLERKKVLDELAEKIALVKELETILADDKRILTIVVDELELIKKIFGDERRTRVIKNAIGEFGATDLIPDEKVIVILTDGNYIKRVPVDMYHAQHRGGKGIKGMGIKDDDSVKHLFYTSTHDELLFFSNLGKIFKAKVYEVPQGSRIAKGNSLANLISLGPDEQITAVLPLTNTTKGKYLLMTTRLGKIKKTEIDAYSNVRRNGIIAIKLNKDDELDFCQLTTGSDNVILVTQNGQGIFFKEINVRPMGRSAAGVRAIKLRAEDKVIAMDVVAKDDNPDLLTVLGNGYGKRTTIRKHFKVQNRGGMGIIASKVNKKTGKVIHAMVIEGLEGDLLLVSQKGTIIRMSLKSVKRLGRNTMGVTLMRMKSGDTVSSVGLIKKDGEPIVEIDETLKIQDLKLDIKEAKESKISAGKKDKDEIADVNNIPIAEPEKTQKTKTKIKKVFKLKLDKKQDKVIKKEFITRAIDDGKIQTETKKSDRKMYKKSKLETKSDFEHNRF